MKSHVFLGVFAASIFTGSGQSQAGESSSPIVLELFTSQSCSSCPPADALLQEIAASDPQVIALSYHVDYWDQLDWKDPFSLPGSTARQRLYEQTLSQNNVYTPELVVNGTTGVIGSRRGEVEALIARARDQIKPVTVNVGRADDSRSLLVSFTGSKPAGAVGLSAWLVSFSPKAVTAVRGGENSGRELTSINNVSSVSRLGDVTLNSGKPVRVEKTGAAADDYAVLVQDSTTGHIVGAASYKE